MSLYLLNLHKEHCRKVCVGGNFDKFTMICSYDFDKITSSGELLLPITGLYC